MNGLKPTSGDRELAEEISKALCGGSYYPTDNAKQAAATLIARDRSEREAGLRTEVQRLRQLVESAFREGCASLPYGQSQNQAWWASRARAAVKQQENTP